MKKAFCLVLLLALCLICCACGEDAEVASSTTSPTQEERAPTTPTEKEELTTPSEGLEYTANSSGTGYIVTGIGTCLDQDVVIPVSHQGMPVIEIGAGAFANCTILTSVTIPESVTSIENEAFSCCTSLTEIVISDGVRSIGFGAFYCCTSLTSITIPASVTNITSNPFDECISLSEIIVDPNNPVYHSDGNCLIDTNSKILVSGCKNSCIPADGSVIGIGYGAFEECIGLELIAIPVSVTVIDEAAFAGCSSLTRIMYIGTKDQWGDIYKGEYWNLYTGDYIIYCTDGEITK